MKKIVHSLVLSGLISVPMMAVAEESPHSLSANVSLTSDYIFRGISQTGGDPAIQGGFDYAHGSGFYIGTWASNVGWIEDFQGYQSGSLELDIYAGYGGSLGDISYDLGIISYMYPGDRSGAVDADTTELYASLGWKWFTLKYSHSISSGTFGFSNSRGSNYLNLAASVPLGETGLTLDAHWGTFSFKNNGAQDYEDWKIGLAYDLGQATKAMSGMTVGIAFTDTNANSAVWTNLAPSTTDLSKSATTVWLSKSF